MQTLRSRLILSHILPLLISMPLMGFALVYILETQVLLSEMSAGITDRAELIAEAVNGQPEILTDAEQAETFINRVGILVDGRVMLFTPSGELLASNSGLFEDLDGLDQAVAGDFTPIVRYSIFEQHAQAFIPVRDINEQLIGIVAVTKTLTGIAHQFARLRWWILGVLFTELVLGAAIGIVLAQRLERPIGRAANAVVDIAHYREIETVPEEGPQEIRALAASVNVLAERLRLLEDIRRRSLANIVHEIGRPLGAIRSAVHVLRQGAGDDPEIREELLGGVENEIERMQPLLDDLSQLHGQVQQSIQLNLQAHPLSDWLPPTLLPWRAVALEKNLQWSTNIPADLPVTYFDPERLAQVLGNVLSNAIKYTPKGGQVSVKAGADDENIWIEVRDTGPGVAEAEQSLIFEPFYRSSREKRFPQGLGVGLTLARELVQAHGGDLTIQSTVNEGSRFTIWLPRQ